MAQGLSQRQISRLFGLTTSAPVSRWEHGEKIPSLDNALMLSIILKAPVEALFAERVAELQAVIEEHAAKVARPSRRLTPYEPTQA